MAYWIKIVILVHHRGGRNLWSSWLCRGYHKWFPYFSWCIVIWNVWGGQCEWLEFWVGLNLLGVWSRMVFSAYWKRNEFDGCLWGSGEVKDANAILKESHHVIYINLYPNHSQKKGRSSPRIKLPSKLPINIQPITLWLVSHFKNVFFEKDHSFSYKLEIKMLHKYGNCPIETKAHLTIVWLI